MRAYAHTTANARSILILSGIGLCHRRAGRYAEAISSYQSALTTAQRLDRVSSVANVNSSLASCYRDIGDVNAQRSFALRGARLAPPVNFHDVCALYRGVEACVLLGDAQHAQELGGYLDAAPQATLKPRTRQMWLMCRADLAWLLGRTDQALVLARAAVIDMPEGTPHRSNVSSLARWLAVLRNNGAWDGAFEGAASQIEGIEGVCWWDEAERLRALANLGSPRRCRYETELVNALELLPANALTYFARYGL